MKLFEIIKGGQFIKKKQKKMEMIIICSFLLITISFMIFNLDFLMTNPLKNNENLRELYPPRLSSTPLWNYSTDSTALSVAISANGRYIVAGSQNHMVYFFENSSSTPVWVNGSAGSTLAMSSDGKYIVTIGGIGKDIFLFNRSSSTPLWIYPATNWINNLAFSTDGNYIIAGGDSEFGSNVYFFNVTNTIDPLLWKYKTFGDIRSVAISSNGSYIAVGDDNYKIYLFNKSSSTPMQVWSTSGDVDSIAISSNGEYIVAGSRDHNVYLFNLSSSTPIWSYTTGGIVHSVAISSDGNHIVAGGGYIVASQTRGIVYFFDKSSSTPLWDYTAGSNVRSVAFSSNGRYIVVGGSGTLPFTRVIHLFQSLYSTPLAKYSISGSYSISVSISSNGDYIAAAIDSNIYLFHKSGFDDEYEENDNFYEAPILTEGNYTDLTLNGIDQDYFGINISSTIKIEIEILFDHGFGNLNLYLYDPSQIQINSSISNTNDEYLSYISNSSGIFTILVDSASDNSIQPYELRIKISVIPYVLPICIDIISLMIVFSIVGSLGLIYGNRKYSWLKNFKRNKQIKLKEKKYEHSKIMLNRMIRKRLYLTPIYVFFVAWWVDVGIAISYLGPYLENLDLNIGNWVVSWAQLTDNYLIYTNTFSSFFFGCYSWSIITFYLGTLNQKRFMRAIKSIYLCYPFWFGMCAYLGIIGVESYYNEWLLVHVIFGIWVVLGSIIAIYMVFSESSKLYGGPRYTIPRKKSIKLRDFLDRFQAFFFILIISIVGTLLSILLWKELTNLAFGCIFWTFLTILLIFLLNYLFSMKINYHTRVKQEEEEEELNEFQIILMRSKELAEMGNKNYSKTSYQTAIENWEKSISFYEEALKKAVEKEKINENLKILKESIFNAYKGKANGHNKDALKAYEKSDLQIAQKEWRLAISSFQSSIDLNKDEKLNFSPDDLQKAIKNTEIRLKQLEIEMIILDADNQMKEARSLQKKDLRKANIMVNAIILKYSEAKEKANKNALFKPLSKTLETKIIKCRDFQHSLQDKMDQLIGITPISKEIKVDEMDIIDFNIPSVIKEDNKETLLSIVREFEFLGGQIRFKIGLINNTKFPFTNLKITFNIPDALKWILNEPGYERKGDSLLISKLGVSEKKAVSLYLEPINCMESPINATVSFFDVRDKPHALTMKPKMISITCPIFFTEGDANLARVKSLRRKFAHHDKKIFPLLRSEESLSIFSSILSVLEKFDIKSIFEDFSEEDRFGEAWFYGITKVKKNQIVIYVLLDGTNKKVEIEVSGNDEQQITAFLAEIGDRVRKQLIQNKIIEVDDDFYDIRVTILSNLCPYCYSSISGDQVQNIMNGKIIRCKNCNVDLKIDGR